MPAKKRPQCSCPLGIIKGSCPFSYSNGWHSQRDAMLLQTNLVAVQKSMEKMTLEQMTEARENVSDHLLEEG